jgi:hypothetical protein
MVMQYGLSPRTLVTCLIQSFRKMRETTNRRIDDILNF